VRYWLAVRRPAATCSSHPPGANPDGEGDIDATLLRRGDSRAGGTPPCRPGRTRIYRLLLPTALADLRRRGVRLLRAGPAAIGRRRVVPHPTLHHRLGLLRPRARSCAGCHREELFRRGCSCTASPAGGLIVSRCGLNGSMAWRDHKGGVAGLVLTAQFFWTCPVHCSSVADDDGADRRDCPESAMRVAGTPLKVGVVMAPACTALPRRFDYKPANGHRWAASCSFRLAVRRPTWSGAADIAASTSAVPNLIVGAHIIACGDPRRNRSAMLRRGLDVRHIARWAGCHRQTARGPSFR